MPTVPLIGIAFDEASRCCNFPRKSCLGVRSRWHKQAPVCVESLDRIEQTRSLPGFLFSKRTLRINNRKYYGAQIFYDIMVCHIVFIILAASECALALD
jgi:hypothetical protein